MSKNDATRRPNDEVLFHAFSHPSPVLTSLIRTGPVNEETLHKAAGIRLAIDRWQSAAR
jgi:hypothetical protein